MRKKNITDGEVLEDWGWKFWHATGGPRKSRIPEGVGGPEIIPEGVGGPEIIAEK